MMLHFQCHSKNCPFFNVMVSQRYPAQGMIPAIVTSVEEMLKKWVHNESKEMDVFKEFTVMSSDVISRTAFSSSYMKGKDIFRKLGELAIIAARNTETVYFTFLR